jgi:hypothetical protein
MHLFYKARPENKSAVLPAGSAHRPRSINGESQGDSRVTHELLFTALTGLLAVLSAIFTTMIELGQIWRYAWLAVCILFAVLMLLGIFGICSAISLAPISSRLPQPSKRRTTKDD